MRLAGGIGLLLAVVLVAAQNAPSSTSSSMVSTSASGDSSSGSASGSSSATSASSSSGSAAPSSSASNATSSGNSTSSSANATSATSVSITATASNIVSGSLAGTAPAPGPNQPGKVGPDDTHFVSAALHTSPMWGPMVVSTLFLWMWVM
ncbi:hypothetical protein Malapachy_0706 [Malassezia pachydermatis]|uniref:Uncharacterized protein n=1 Tax=Malassezia pachydermatis TaxID=77020 RepID=A0A0M8MWD2_9BASI|nr:hypothetical protein Malapachy_0706 [Malassezia pachydermatis]KOS14881.1 hypothetical protein Malapachy_0706 [Malassezia pachydermatis]